MIYSFPSYVPGIAIAVAVLAASIGVLLLWRRQPLVVALIAFGVSAVAGGLFAPMLAMDRVVLDDDKLEQTTGFWFAPTVKGFRLAEVESIAIGTARDRKNRKIEVWIVKGRDGQTREIDPGDLWEMNGQDILRRLREKGIDVR
ncbi:hypothetical protein predicted by Glimmer/Critica [Sorangium cellulosum So ce56]|uniref:Uncharacterized protein n=1 Tax=Sorangium cellulosum (strain So ce56) TaxID=448385 RepID=A9GYK5_SORC5|nr:hypothetical protein [Sorangium cellulosum]CAN97254.1 hypothetical protein predicted by Glimmer/Critica [Sorangium cellulosum So ce56]